MKKSGGGGNFFRRFLCRGRALWYTGSKRRELPCCAKPCSPFFSCCFSWAACCFWPPGTLSGQLSGNLPLSNLIGDRGSAFGLSGRGRHADAAGDGQGVPPGGGTFTGCWVWEFPSSTWRACSFPGLWLTASWLTEYPALFLIPGFSLALTIPGKSPTAGKYVEKKDKKKEKSA